MVQLIFWRGVASITSGLLQVRVLLFVLVLAYVVGWILGSVYGQGL